MTETTTAPAAGQEVYPDAIGFGFAELIALLNLQHGPAATASAEALRVANELENPMILSAGASSLVARGGCHGGAGWDPVGQRPGSGGDPRPDVG